MLINLRTNRVPVPFMGGKILARGVMTETLYRLVDDIERMTTIDFFGGSGLLSQWCIEAGFKHVVWNDFDDYQGRIRYYLTDRYRNYINWARDYLYEELKIENGVRVHDPHAEPIRQRLLEEFKWAEETASRNRPHITCSCVVLGSHARPLPPILGRFQSVESIPISIKEDGDHWRTDGVIEPNWSAATIGSF